MARNRLANEFEEARKRGGGIRPGSHPEFEDTPKAAKIRKPKAGSLDAIKVQIEEKKAVNRGNRALNKRMGR